ncbi:MAG: transketolase [Candidatus Eisenbacteria bacterium]
MGLNRDELDRLAVNTIRTLSMDAVQKANSGHPGTPMALAPVAYCLWQRFLRYDPADPLWPNRDRFVLSAGHASMLLYSMLHLSGVRSVGAAHEVLERPSVTLDDIRDFRQLGSSCPGHPEHGLTAGVETTTGPLGQGVATSVGMAIAGRFLAARFNRPRFEMFDFDVYALAGDGDLMEGVSAEAASLAGHLELSNLCWIYDSNGVTIEGRTDITFSEDVGARFEAYGWNVVRAGDANDLAKLSAAFEAFREIGDRPTLVIVDSHIAYGAPNKQDTSAAHGEPLGKDEVRLAKRSYGWDEDATFLVPDGVREHLAAGMGARGRELRERWAVSFGEYEREHPELARELTLMQRRELPDEWDNELPDFAPDVKGVAGRVASGTTLNRLAENVPWLMGGSADLAPSNKTALTFEGAGDFAAGSRGGRNIHFGIREHAMGAVLNGLALSGLRPYGATFLVFSDYARPAMRLSALMELPVVYVFTHDSISVGEDGPTHQPVEQLASLRSVPGLVVLRPADATEVVDAWRVIMQLRDEPAALVLSRQALPVLDRDRYARSQVARGGYVLADCRGAPEVLLIATGSEVSLCLEVRERLASEGVGARVVSMPSWELFERQDRAYRDSVIPPGVPARVTVEQAATFGWERYAGTSGEMIGIDTFGASGPAADVQAKYGFTADAVLAAARRQLEAPGG